jgi:hypothetical protein
MANEVKLDPNGGSPSINLIFGFAQFAKFRIFLWDQNGQNPQEITHGSNLPGAPSTFPIPVPAANLIGRFMTWDALIVSPTGGPGQQYSMTATFSQNGNTIQDATFRRSGTLDGAAVDMDQTKFVS